MIEYIPKEHIYSFFELINHAEIKYVLIKNLNNELPHKLKNGKDIDIIVHPENEGLFFEKMKTQYDQICHPMGTRNGWQFLYGLKEGSMWKRRNIGKADLYIDEISSLSCCSLMDKTWIPLDQEIQKRLWQCKKWDAKNHWWITDNETRFIYLLARCVFDKKTFSEAYKIEIDNLFREINYQITRMLLERVFFKYTDELLKQVKERDYSNILNNYLSYSQY